MTRLILEATMQQVGLSSFPAGATIIRQGDEAKGAFFILSGRVQVTQEHADGVVVLGEMGPGQVFGEMAVIECRPRSATVTALEPTEVRVFDRDEVQEIIRTDHELTVSLLKAVFERLRLANARLAAEPSADATALPTSASHAVESLTLVAETPEAARALGADQMVINRFPFAIGRASDDRFVRNDLAIEDALPFRLSRAHLALVKDGAMIGALDRGSHLGSVVNGTRIGPDAQRGPIYFQRGEGTLVLGDDHSPYRFRVLAG